VEHVPPPEHPAFYSSSKATLNVTRSAMANFGYCPSGRLFEAAACATPVISDSWEGLGEFFEPGREILVASSADDVVHAIELGDEELRRVGKAAREKVFSAHTADHRSREFLQYVETLV
jgi:spore maturation protein CgeB